VKRTIQIGVSDLGSVAVFVKVAECLNFSLAADRLGLGKATVSDHIARLESVLGVRLLVRTTRSVRLTEAGALFLEHGQRLMSGMDSAFAAVGALREKPKGQLRVSVPVAIGRQLIAPLVPKFLKQYPEISLELLSTDRFVDLAAESVDMAIRHTEEPDPHLMAWNLCDVQWHVVASPAYLKRHGTPARINDLAHHNCIFYSVRGRQAEWKFHIGSETRSVAVAGNFKANNSEMLREAVLGGTGIGLLPDFSCHPYLAEGKMVALLKEYKVEGSFGSKILAVSLWTANIAPKVRVFVDFLREEFHGRHGRSKH
jgi:DNA-binding transcriptional LysR family regulator